jgi:general secretion pathway protein G
MVLRDIWVRGSLGFTLIELLVVLSIVALLLAIVSPRYMGSIDHAKEVTLKEDLKVMRLSIDRFQADKGRYPESLAELVDERYLRGIPPDPITDSTDTWVVVPVEAPESEGISDVRSGAQGVSKDGSPYAGW